MFLQRYQHILQQNWAYQGIEIVLVLLSNHSNTIPHLHCLHEIKMDVHKGLDYKKRNPVERVNKITYGGVLLMSNSQLLPTIKLDERALKNRGLFLLVALSHFLLEEITNVRFAPKSHLWTVFNSYCCFVGNLMRVFWQNRVFSFGCTLALLTRGDTKGLVCSKISSVTVVMAVWMEN